MLSHDCRRSCSCLSPLGSDCGVCDIGKVGNAVLQQHKARAQQTLPVMTASPSRLLEGETVMPQAEENNKRQSRHQGRFTVIAQKSYKVGVPESQKYGILLLRDLQDLPVHLRV